MGFGVNKRNDSDDPELSMSPKNINVNDLKKVLKDEEEFDSIMARLAELEREEEDEELALEMEDLGRPDESIGEIIKKKRKREEDEDRDHEESLEDDAKRMKPEEDEFLSREELGLYSEDDEVWN